jgi:hypothetical protein
MLLTCWHGQESSVAPRSNVACPSRASVQKMPVGVDYRIGASSNRCVGRWRRRRDEDFRRRLRAVVEDAVDQMSMMVQNVKAPALSSRGLGRGSVLSRLSHEPCLTSQPTPSDHVFCFETPSVTSTCSLVCNLQRCAHFWQLRVTALAGTFPMHDQVMARFSTFLHVMSCSSLSESVKCRSLWLNEAWAFPTWLYACYMKFTLITHC